MRKQFKAINRSCREQDVAFDIKYALQDLYLAKFVSNGSKMQILFDNGQIFFITIKERK